MKFRGWTLIWPNGRIKYWPDERRLRGQEASNKLWALRAIGIVVFVMILAFALLFLSAVFS